MDMTWDTIYFSVFSWKLDLKLERILVDILTCVWFIFFLSVRKVTSVFSEDLHLFWTSFTSKGVKEKKKQAVSWHHVFRVQWSPCPPTLWGASRTPSSPPSWGTHAPHRAPPPNGWTTSVLLPVHETQNGPHQRCIHLSLWWPLRQMVSARKILFCLMSWIARCPFSFFFGWKCLFLFWQMINFFISVKWRVLLNWNAFIFSQRLN